MKARGLALLLVAACATKQAPPPAAPTRVVAKAAAPVKYAESPSVRLTADVVVATIRDKYLNGVERCASRHAKLHGTTGGRVMLSFTVDENGKVHDGNAHGIASRVDRCITAQVARWTFPAPMRESSFALGLQVFTD